MTKKRPIDEPMRTEVDRLRDTPIDVEELAKQELLERVERHTICGGCSKVMTEQFKRADTWGIEIHVGCSVRRCIKEEKSERVRAIEAITGRGFEDLVGSMLEERSESFAETMLGKPYSVSPSPAADPSKKVLFGTARGGGKGREPIRGAAATMITIDEHADIESAMRKLEDRMLAPKEPKPKDVPITEITDSW